MSETTRMLMQHLLPTRGMMPSGQIFEVDATPNESFIRTLISTWETSEYRKRIIDAEKYFKNRNDIYGKKRNMVTTDGAIGESLLLSNSKIAHPFVRKLVRQKVSFLFSSPFEIKALNNDIFTEILNSRYFNDQVRNTLKTTISHAVCEGICFLMPYYNDLGKLAFKKVSAKNSIPFWADEEHTQMNAFLHYYDIYKITDDNTGIVGTSKKLKIRKIEYFTPEGVWYYMIDEMNTFKADPDAIGNNEINAHFYQGIKKLSDTGVPETDQDGNQLIDLKGQSWNVVPIIPFKYNDDELPLLELVKSLIDDYDGITSSISDNVHDVPDSIKVVKGYSGTDPNAFVRNVATYRVIFLDPEGSVDELVSELHISEVDMHLERLRKDIFEAGDGIDIQTDQLGDVSGAALKYRFSPLAEDVNDLASESIRAMQQMIYYIAIDLKLRNTGNYLGESVEIKFPQVAITNEAETIDNISKSMNLVSRETLLAHHPYVNNVAKEIELFDAQQKADLALENSILPAVNKGTVSVKKKPAVIGSY